MCIVTRRHFKFNINISFGGNGEEGQGQEHREAAKAQGGNCLLSPSVAAHVLHHYNQ